MKFCIPLPALLMAASCSPGLGPVVPQTPIQKQMIGLLEKFDRWDDDGSGDLDRSEIEHGINSLKGKPQQVSYTADDVMAFYDTNRNGRITLAEAQAGYRRAHEAERLVQS